jgi:REP element-mobilizing transposase RayT
MPRLKLIRTAKFPYHVTVRTNNKEWFPIELDHVWSIMKRFREEATEKYKAEVIAFVLMSNHLHMILRTPDLNLDQIMCYFLTKSSKRIQFFGNRINHIFGRRYHWNLLEEPRSFAYVYKYVARNPIRAGLCKSVEDYPYSSFNPLNKIMIPENLKNEVPRNPEEILKWLNHPCPKEFEEIIKQTLKRRSFKFSTTSNRQKNIRHLKAAYQIEFP